MGIIRTPTVKSASESLRVYYSNETSEDKALLCTSNRLEKCSIRMICWVVGGGIREGV